MKEVEKLNDRFLEELFHLILIKQPLFERVVPILKYQYLPSAEYKEIYKSITTNFNLSNKIPSFGILFEQHKHNINILSLLDRIKGSEVVAQDILLKQLDVYIKEVRFSKLWDDVREMYDKGDREKGIELMSKESSEINEFSIFKDSGDFIKVYSDFEKRQLVKEIEKENNTIIKKKIPTGILPIDNISYGGIDKKETLLFILRSGVGKSTLLKWCGMYACRLGYKVLHIQCEGSEEEVFDKYTQLWTAESYRSIQNANINIDTYKKLKKIAKDMVANGQDIDIKAFEQFDEVDMKDVRECVVEYIKENGYPPDLLILDSIDLVNPGDGIKYGVDTQSVKMKLQNSSRKFKNICNEFNMAGATATQTADVPISIWNDPNKYLTRSDSMGDKNIANSYSFVITGNQTIDEEKKNIMRLYFDKIRHYGLKQRIYPICTNYDLGRAYDMKRTLKIFQDIYVNE